MKPWEVWQWEFPHGSHPAVIVSPEALCADIHARFGGAPSVVDGTVRLEREAGHAFVPQLVEAFPGQITSVTIGQPTLEDVFVHHTGHRVTEDPPA